MLCVNSEFWIELVEWFGFICDGEVIHVPCSFDEKAHRCLKKSNLWLYSIMCSALNKTEMQCPEWSFKILWIETGSGRQMVHYDFVWPSEWRLSTISLFFFLFTSEWKFFTFSLSFFLFYFSAILSCQFSAEIEITVSSFAFQSSSGTGRQIANFVAVWPIERIHYVCFQYFIVFLVCVLHVAFVITNATLWSA
jgi:hypothetical protein